MIAIQTLLNTKSPLGNYFSPEAYVLGDFESGLIENRNGDRLIAIPTSLIEGIYASLEDELGSSGTIVLFKWGLRWGKSFYRRFAGEVSQYYEKPLAEFEMVELLQCLKQCWKTYGWGILKFNATYYQHGFLTLSLQNAPFATLAPQGKRPMAYVEAGILSAFFTQVTGRNLHCVQTTCESMGAGQNHFVLGLADRLKPIAAWLEEGHDHDTIMSRLCGQQSTAALSAKTAPVFEQQIPPSVEAPATPEPNVENGLDPDAMMDELSGQQPVSIEPSATPELNIEDGLDPDAMMDELLGGQAVSFLEQDVSSVMGDSVESLDPDLILGELDRNQAASALEEESMQ